MTADGKQASTTTAVTRVTAPTGRSVPLLVVDRLVHPPLHDRGLVANRLAAETSPYLLQHADNPVDWYPWGEEAFARARDEDKPILLSVGYAACHWCHVMAHESFEDDETAALMNEHFVSVKVDREERPDVDSLYMDAVVALTGQRRLADDGLPDARGRAVLRRHVLPAGAAPRPAELQPGARRGRGRLPGQAAATSRRRPRRSSRRFAASSELAAVAASRSPRACSARRRARCDGQFDAEWGGWGGAPKFPQASTLEFLLAHARRRARCRRDATLDAMAAGGMYDLVGGGFHRYSVDRAWLVPHFEKMLYDNALLAATYLHAWVVTGNERYRRVVEETLDYLLRELRLPEGGFASAQDADTDGVEGLTFTWTPEEGVREELLLPFEDGRYVIRGELRTRSANGSSSCVRSARSPPATTRRSRPGTGSPSRRWPKRPVD